MIGFRGSTDANPEWGSALSIDLPVVPGVQKDDFMFAFIASNYGATVQGIDPLDEAVWEHPSASWPYDAGQAYRLDLWRHRVLDPAAEPESYPFTTSSGGIAGVCVGYSNLHFGPGYQDAFELLDITQGTDAAPTARSVMVDKAQLAMMVLAAPNHEEVEPIAGPSGFSLKHGLYTPNVFTLVEAPIENWLIYRDAGPKQFGLLSSSTAWNIITLLLIPSIVVGTSYISPPV